MQSLIGQTLGGYQIVEQIGMGGMATIYRAYQSSMDRYVAVKVLPQQIAAEDPTFLGRFEQEARTIAKLEHRNILPVYDYGEAQGYAYLVMRYVDAGTLKDLIAQGPLPPGRAARLARQVAEALDHAHRQGVVHRDIKPSNVLIDAQDHAYLMDFGIARLLSGSARFTGTDVLIGTPAYMSPEQAQGRPADPRSDLYSLGVILYEMVTGQAPYEAETPMAVMLKHIQAPLTPPRALREDLPPALERIILKAMAKDPDDRYQSAAEMAAALERALTQADTEPATAGRAAPTEMETASVPAGRRPPPPGVLFAAGVALFGVLALVLVLLVGGSGIPAAGTPILDVGATDRFETEVAAQALQPPTTGTAPAAGVGAPGEAAPAWAYYIDAGEVRDLLSVGDAVYAATSGGLVRWTLDGTPRRYTPAEGLPFLAINRLAVDEDGSLWLGGEGTGVARLTLAEDGAISGAQRFGQRDGLPDEWVSALWLDAGDALWAGLSWGRGAFYDGQAWHAGLPIPLDAPELEPLGEQINVITRTGDGAIWLGMAGGLARWDPQTGAWWAVTSVDLTGEELGVGLIYEDRQGRLIIAAGPWLWQTDLERSRRPDTWENLSPALGECWASGLVQAADDSYWLACSGDAVRYVPEGGQVTRYGVDDGLPGYLTGPLLEDAQGRVWAGTDNGVALYEAGRWRPLRLEQQGPGLGQYAFLRRDEDGLLWAAPTYPGRVARLDPASGAWSHYMVADAEVSGLAVEGGGDTAVIWLATPGQGLYRYQVADGRVRRYTEENDLSSDQVHALALDGEGFLWLGTEFGIDRLDPATGDFTFYEFDTERQHLDRITLLYPAPDGTLWAGHGGRDTYAVRSDAVRLGFATVEAASGTVNALYELPLPETARRALDAVTDSVGAAARAMDAVLQAWDGGERQDRLAAAADMRATVDQVLAAVEGLSQAELSGPAREQVRALAGQARDLRDAADFIVDAMGMDWGYERAWLFRYDAAADAFRRVRDPQAPTLEGEPPYLADVTTDGAGDLWVGVAWGGLYRWDGHTWRWLGGEDGAPIEEIRAVLGASDGRLWVGTAGQGLFNLDPAGWFQVPWDADLGTRNVYALLEAPDGTLWIGTDHGLIAWRGEP